MISVGKIVGVVLLTGLVGSAGVGGYIYATSESTIEYLLKSDNKKRTILVTGATKEDSARAWKSYQNKNTTKTANADTWKLSDWANKHNADQMPESLIAKCQTEKTKKIKNRTDTAYIQFVDWCTKEG